MGDRQKPTIYRRTWSSRVERMHATLEVDRKITKKAARLLVSMALAMVIVAFLMVVNYTGSTINDDFLLTEAIAGGEKEIPMDGQGIAERVVEQKFQVHMEEMPQQIGEIPYVEIWVLNDPFYPLMGEVGNLRSNDGTLAGKQWQMLGFPDYEQSGTTTGSAPTTSPSSSLPVTTSIPQRVVMLKDVYEVRGIRYADIKVNDNTYAKLKAGSEFAEIYKVKEVKSGDSVVVLCGDEAYELKKNELRKI